MNNRNSNKSLKLYGIIGKVLCALAGGIVGFVLGGPMLAIPGVLVGAISGHFLEKAVVCAS